MASPSDLAKKAVEEALMELESCASEEYAELNAEQKRDLTVAAWNLATLMVELDKEYCNDETNAQDITTLLSKHLSPDNIKLIEGGLNIPTFQTIIEENNDQYILKLIRGGAEFMASRPLVTSDDIAWAIRMQDTNLLIEIVLLSMSICGIAENITDERMKQTATEVVPSSIMKKAVDTFTQAWDSAAGDVIEQAKAVFTFMKDSKISSMIWTIIKGLLSNKSPFDWLLTCVKVLTMIIAAVSTGGTAIVAALGLAVISAFEIVQTLSTRKRLSELQKTD